MGYWSIGNETKIGNTLACKRKHVWETVRFLNSKLCYRINKKEKQLHICYQKYKTVAFFLNMKVLSIRVALLRNSLKENKNNLNFYGIMLISYSWTCEVSRNIFKCKEVIWHAE